MIVSVEGLVGIAIGVATFMLAHWTGRRRGYNRGYKIGRWDMAREIILAYEKHREPEQQVDAMDAAAWRELGVMRRPRD